MVSIQLLVAFLVAGVSVVPVWQTGAQDNTSPGQQHLALMEKSVKDIASIFGDIYGTACGTGLQNCKICSADMCQPPPKGSTTCLKTNSNLYDCAGFLKQKVRNGEGVASCFSISIAESQSSVTYVRSDVHTAPTDIQASSICRTQQLDQTFKDLYNRTPIYTDYYMGTVDGTRRTYPGKEEEVDACVQYDNRKRPWYTGGTSYPNYLVILIDCGHDMGDHFPPGSEAMKLNLAQTHALQLLETVNQDDYVNVITFGADSADTYTTSVQVKVNFSNSQDHPELKGLQTKINNLAPAAGSTPVEEFVRGLNTSLTAFSDSSLPNLNRNQRLQNVILLTDGSFADGDVSTNPSVVAALGRLRSNNIRLFIYGMNAASPSDVNLQTLANTTDGFYDNVNRPGDALYYMRSYFGYLALSHNTLYGGLPFWTETYQDYFLVGSIVTVAMPAFTRDSQFIGVAAVDVILDELSADLNKDFVSAVNQRTQGQKRTMKANATSVLTAPVRTILNASSCQYDNSKTLCSRGAIPSGETVEDRKCCNSCSKGDEGKQKNGLPIILGTSFGGLAVLSLLALGAFLLRRKKKKKQRDTGSIGRAATQDPGRPLKIHGGHWSSLEERPTPLTDQQHGQTHSDVKESIDPSSLRDRQRL